MDPALHWILRLGLALVFAVSALAKLRSLGEFRRTLRAYGVLPPALEGVAAPLVPLLELAAAGLLLGSRTDAGAFLLLGLLALFSGAILVGLRRGGGFSCGCLGGLVDEPLSPALLLRNAVLALLVGLLLYSPSARPLEPLDWITVLFGGLLFFLAYLGAGTLLANSVRLKDLGGGR